MTKKKKNTRVKKKKSTNNVEKELIYKTKKEWISKATVNKSQYEKKYNLSIKNNEDFWAKEGKQRNTIMLITIILFIYF